MIDPSPLPSPSPLPAGASGREQKEAWHGAPQTQEALTELKRKLARAEGGRGWFQRWAVWLIVAALIAGIVAWRVLRRSPPSAKYIAQGVSEGDVTETVQSTGTVKPVTEVQVGAQVSGRIQKVYVDFNSNVKKGDPLAEIDPLTFGAQVEQQRAQFSAQEAALNHATANANAMEISLARLKKLRAESLASQSDVDAAQGQYDIAFADIAQAKAQIEATRAQMTSARANLSYTRIFAPIDGVVTNRAIDPGQTVAASFQAPVLFTIAEDLRKMRVLADIDEADVGKLSEGMTAETQVDAFPGEKFFGKVSQIRYNPNTVQGVVTYQAVIELENPERKLRPGMTSTVTVRTHEVKDVLRLANASLRYKPSLEKGPNGKPIPRLPEKALEPHTGRVYVLTQATPGQEKIEPRVVHIGITDGIFTELVSKDLAKDTKLVVDETDEKDAQKRGPRIF